ncbi:sensor histidine kinase [Vallitalea guaymasensis]|uniref:sensor histidine kinase n=1 Tax=Vallitalea guaymasensis TaxID=1185412 RepID=UPI00272BD328|nr:histidine kinase [Vallitalea guaymasensis]
MKSSRLFIKNVIVFLIPVLLPVIVLGSVSILITKQYVYENIKHNNNNILKQEKGNIELIFNEIDSLYINFSTNPEIIVELKKILRKPLLNREEYQMVQTIRKFIDAPANAKPYINSIYVFFENDHGRILTTTEGLISNYDYYDMEWKKQFYEMDNSKNTWLENRTIKPYSFDKKGKRVVTVYRTINAYGSKKREGMIVLNIDTDYIDNLLNKLDVIPEQCILVTDENNNIIFKNKDLPYLKSLKIDQIINSNDEYIIQNIENEKYIISKLKSNQYGCNFLSIVPEKKLYKIPNLLTKIVTCILVFLIIIGITFTYYFMKKRIKRLRNIVRLLDYAEQGVNISGFFQDPKDEYGYITNKIIETNLLQRYFKVQLSERKYKQKTLELLAMNSQINPHFLYNTLETIYWKAFEFTKKPNKITDMIEDLSDILKYSLHAEKEQVTIKEEIENTKSYIKLQKVRYLDKFQVIWEYDEEILENKIIRLALQPIIENSIYHGIKEKEGNSEIRIRIHREGEYIKFQIMDNGLGIKKNRLIEIREKLEMEDPPRGHIGILNTNKRLSLMYGIESKLYIDSEYQEGTTVHFSVPKE